MQPSSLPAGRYFLALWPSAPVRDAIAEAATDWLADSTAPCRRLPPAHYHLTLHFLGDLTADASHRLHDRLCALATWQPACFRLRLDRFGHFGRRVGWLGCRRAPSALHVLQQGLARAMREVHPPGLLYPAFAPHVTLARDVRGDWPPGDAAPARPVAWDVHEWVLARSVRAPGHAYRIMARYSLGAP